MFLADTSVKRPVFATMVIAALIIFGYISMGRMGINQMPEIDFPVVTITTMLFGADPETVETEVTDVIEEAVNSIDGVKELNSTSSEGISSIVIEFELEKAVDVAVQDVRDKVAGVRGQLPEDIEEPLISKLDMQSFPVITLVISGEEVSADKADAEIRRITEYTKRQIKERLQTIKGVGSVRIIGGQEREIRIWLDADKLRGYQIPVEVVMAVLRSENVEIPGGRIETDESELVVKTHGDIETVEEFNDLVVAYQETRAVRLRDIAFVEDGMEDLRSISFVNGNRAVALECRKTSGGNAVAVAEEIKSEIENLRKILPEDIKIGVAVDNSRFTRDAIEDVQIQIIMGAVLAVITILFFLRSWRTSLISAIVIPTAVISTFTFISILGFTVNMLTMLALAISVGMLIDDAVVVIENIYRQIEAGEKDTKKAAMKGAAEIGLAVITTSATVVGVFVPIAFMKGIVGRFFYEFGITVTIAVIISTFTALTLTPMLCSRFLKVKRDEDRIFIDRWITRFLRSLDGGYRVLLSTALRHRIITMLIAIGVFVGSLYLAGLIPGEFMPTIDEGIFTVNIEAPLGSSLQETTRYTKQIEEIIRKMPGVELVYTSIGGGQLERVNEAALNVKLISEDQRDFTQAQFMDAARERLTGFPDLKIAVAELNQTGGSFASYQLQYSLRGTDIAELEHLATSIKEGLAEIPGFVDLRTTYQTGKPEVGIHINRDRAADLGVSVATVATAVRALVGGEDVSTFQSEGKKYDVRIRLKGADRDNPGDIDRLMVRSRTGQPVELGNIVEVSRGFGPTQIDRRDRMREITVQTNITSDLPLGTAVSHLLEVADKVGIPPDVSPQIVGMAEVMQESFESMSFALFLAIVIIYMVLASLFESFVHPFTIMFSLPLSISGAMGLLLIAGHSISIMSMIGVIMLFGLVTKNAILLVDFTNQLRRQGMKRIDAILTAGPRRLRPILMTTLSTIFGNLPIAIGFGAGASFRASMGVAIIGGLMTSTLLTLVVVPVVYSLMDDLRFIRLPSWMTFWKRELKPAEAETD
ncbi:MAG TPA: efflux RND transporter permease subunit [Acidobacteriota bacterium]|nr:efflux RND transporter permease subunit [Acidobacteriota bacterium]